MQAITTSMQAITTSNPQNTITRTQDYKQARVTLAASKLDRLQYVSSVSTFVSQALVQCRRQRRHPLLLQ